MSSTYKKTTASISMAITMICSGHSMDEKSNNEIPATPHSHSAQIQVTNKDSIDKQVFNWGEKLVQGESARILDFPCKSCGDDASLIQNPFYEIIYNRTDMAHETAGKTGEELYQLAQNYKMVKYKELHCYTLAAQQGHSESQFQLAMFHYHVNRTYDQSIMAIYSLPLNFYISFYFFSKAAEQGHKTAQCCLGQIYFRGESQNKINPIALPNNYEKAFSYFEKSAAQGWAEAEFMLGKMYGEGKHVECNIGKAIKYLESAVSKGQIEAQSALADLAFHFEAFRQFNEETQVTPEISQTTD